MSSSISTSNASAVVIIAAAFTFLAGMMVGYRLGFDDTRDGYIQNCVHKYGDMPANKVDEYCQNILKFE